MNNTVLLVSKTTAELPFTMTFDANGGISDTVQRDVIVGEKIGDLPNVTYGDKYFDGWFSSRIGGTRISADTLAGAKFKTVYAHWIDPVAIDFDATTNGGTLVPHDYKYYPTVPFGNLPEAEGPSDKPYLDGWWTTASGDGVKISKSDVVGDVRKYYARYNDYNDPLGIYICPTKNLYFTVQDSGTIALEDRQDHWYSGDTMDCVYLTCGDSAQATLKSTLMGPGTLTYVTRGSTEGAYDNLTFFMDNNYNTSLYGSAYSFGNGEYNNPPYVYSHNTYGNDTGWQPQVSLDIPSGEHDIYWVYMRDGSTSGGENKAWVSNISWNPS